MRAHVTTRWLILAAGSVLGASACTHPPPQEHRPDAVLVPAARPEAAALAGTVERPSPATPGTATSGTVTPGVAAPECVPLRAAVALSARGETALVTTAANLVDPAATFRVEVAVVLPEGRLSLRDEQDAMVPSAGVIELGASWTRFVLAPDAALRTGSLYTLYLDGSASHAPRDASGRALRPLVIPLRTEGERPAPPTRAKARR